MAVPRPLSLSEWRIESGKAAAAAATDAEFYGPTAGLCLPTERRPRPTGVCVWFEGGKEGKTNSRLVTRAGCSGGSSGADVA